MTVTFEEFTEQVVTGRGKPADALSVTLKAALQASLDGNRPIVLKGLDEAGRKTAKGRLPNMATKLAASLSIGYSAAGDLVLTAKPKVVEAEPAAPAVKPTRITAKK